MACLFQCFKKEKALIQVFSNFANKFVGDSTINSKSAGVLMRGLFELINEFKLDHFGFGFFSRFAEVGITNEFNNTKAYAVYYAYQNKNYLAVQKILDNFFIELKSVNYVDVLDFNILNYYKGLIFLSQKVKFENLL